MWSQLKKNMVAELSQLLQKFDLKPAPAVKCAYHMLLTPFK